MQCLAWQLLVSVEMGGSIPVATHSSEGTVTDPHGGTSLGSGLVRIESALPLR